MEAYFLLSAANLYLCDNRSRDTKYVSAQLGTETHTLSNYAITYDNRRLKARAFVRNSTANRTDNRILLLSRISRYVLAPARASRVSRESASGIH